MAVLAIQDPLGVNAIFSNGFGLSRLSRSAAALGILLAFALPVPAQAPGAAPAGAPAAPAGIGAAGPASSAPQTTAPAQTAPAQTTGATTTPVSQGRQGSETNAAGRSVGATAFSQEPLSDFQQLVAASTGRPLPIFGASLFSGVPSTFAPINDVPVGSDYVVGPGDQIAVQLSGQVNQQYNFPVDPTGVINVPTLGAVHVAGVPYGQLQGFLHDQFSRIYRNFALNVNLGALRAIQVFVVGQARAPGTYSISSLSTLLNAVFASGGPLPNGSLRDIQLKRGGKTVTHFDLYDLLLRGDKGSDVRLLSGDVIFIPFAGPQIAVTGSVKTPSIYELKGPTSVADALELAGGGTALAGVTSARLERVFEHSQRSVQDVNLAFGATEMLQNGDILSISSIVERYRNAVTLRGNVANPGRYVWHPGLRISDLIPNKEALITRNYWNRQNQLGQTSLDYLPNSNLSGQTTQGALEVRGTANEIASEQQAESRNREQASGTNGAASSTQNSNGQSTDNNGNSNNGNNQSNAANRPTTAGSQAGGNSVGSALTASNNPFTAQNDVILSAPDIDWSYAVIERLSTADLKTSLIPFNLGKLIMDGDSSQNFELQPNDVITIFSTADIRVPTTQQTRYVRLEGEFVAPGVYSVQPGETLRSLLTRAGGFTPEAFLYASEFTRQSTRRVEAQRLQEYADQLDAEISSVTANNTARAISPSDQISAGASEADARDAVSRLRRVVPTGRIVLDLHPNSVGVDALPDLALEDGDRFVVPRVPSSITVEGQVYNANAFVYMAHRRMTDYLKRAGGPDREADRKREFVLRADGSVISNQYADVKNAPVFPGDTLVIPPIIDRRGLFQKVVDLAGIVSNIGIGAATLYILARGY